MKKRIAHLFKKSIRKNISSNNLLEDKIRLKKIKDNKSAAEIWC